MDPAGVAVRYEDQSVTYAELSARVTALVARLRALGVGRGDRVAYLGPNHPSFLEVLFATARLGAVFTPLNVRLATAELTHQLADSGAVLLVYGEPLESTVADLRAHGCGVRALACGELETVAYPDAALDEPVALEDACVILYTSGTTGHSKGVVLTHGNLTWNCFNAIIENDVAGDERALVVAPLFHAATLAMICLPTLLKGGTTVLVPSFDPDSVLEIIERERITLMFGVPTMFEALADRPRWADSDLSSIRRLLCGGAAVRPATIGRYLDRGLDFGQGYGLTEAAAGVLMLGGAHLRTKAGSVGTPSFFTDVQVVDDGGRPVPRGVPGELVVSGPNVMRGYWGRPDATERTVVAGWLRTGDVGVVDEDGFFTIVDRTKNMFISGGENVYPAEVEAVLATVSGVSACAVIGVPDEKWGEVGKALIVVGPGARPDEAEVLAQLRVRLAAYKVPKSVEFVDALPTTASGKIARSELRGRYADDGGLSSDA